MNANLHESVPEGCSLINMNMKNLLLLLVLTIAQSGFAQDLEIPVAVTDAFNKLFPGQVIASWTDNSYYNYQKDWSDNSYYGDRNLDGYTNENSVNRMQEINSGFTSIYYNYSSRKGFEYNTPQNYFLPPPTAITQYQLDFILNGARKAAIFKQDGTLVMAKGQVDKLPPVVQKTIMYAFSRETFMVENDIEQIITPNYTISNPVYRIKIKIKHGDAFILKVDSKGTILSNDKI